jgi:pantoate--beta-alanine ligase
MKVLSSIADLQAEIRSSDLNPVGLVPTMGALHEGHLSLVHTAVPQCRIVVVSIFVNPTQFNDKKDLTNYPRTLGRDLELLGTVLREKDIVFTPEIKEMYPEEDKRQFSFGNLDNVMEALRRPGHFNGVAQIVSKLLNIVNPHYAYFGIKDFQQLAVIKALARQMNSRVKIVSCPIMREKDGLAMSSRNTLLSPELRKNAPEIYRTISAAAEMMQRSDIQQLKNFVEDRINNIPDYSLEYFEIVDDEDLFPLKSKKELQPEKQYYGCIAVRAGNIRLIDNIRIERQ